MIAYWTMFSLPVLAILVGRPKSNHRSLAFWTIVVVAYSFFIGLRYDVGGDWTSYLVHYDRMSNVPFAKVFLEKDAGYAALNWLSNKVSGQVYLVNFVCGVILMLGVVSFSRRQPFPCLALLVAVPYMIIVVGMGYTRQSAALGFELLAIVALIDGRFYRFALLIICGALFHKSAVILLPLAALASTRKRLWTWTWVAVVSYVMVSLILYEHKDYLWHHYVERSRVSEGGGIRVAMNAVPSLIFLLFRERFAFNDYENKLWTWIAWFSLTCIPLVFFASTAVDRVALYFMPMQLLIFARVSQVVSIRFYRPLIRWGVVAGYALVLFVWLNFASHAFAWLPYQNRFFNEKKDHTFRQHRMVSLQLPPGVG